MLDVNAGRTWANAPSGVRDARALGILGLALCCLALLFAIVGVASSPRAADATILSALVFLALMCAAYVWLLGALRRGVRAAYYIQIVISVLGLAGFPLWTIVNGYILYKWFRPETKAWFGI